jgi:hypothetical protein
MTVWSKVNAGSVVRDGDVTLTLSGYRSLTYRRGDESITIDTSPGDTLGVYARAIDSWSPSERRIKKDERDAILEDVLSALRALEIPYEVLWD